MLKLILGLQKSGKTARCTELAAECVKQNKSVMLLVPEQYSFQCQKHILTSLGEAMSNSVEIHSFTSLSEAILESYGGIAAATVDDTSRYILVDRAIKSVRDSLKIYGSYVSSPSFIKNILSVITEFKQSNVTADSLSTILNSGENGLFECKLHDIMLIMSAYNAMLENRFIDPLDLTDTALSKLKDRSFFERKTVIIDEFKGFTEAQLKLLDRIIADSENVYITFSCDCLDKLDETDIFSSIKQCALRLVGKSDIRVETEILTNEKEKPDIRALEKFLSDRYEGDCPDELENVKVCTADTCYDEIDFVMNTIHKAVRLDSSLRYRDFAIISRSTDGYNDLINEISGYYNIPCYTDRRVPLMSLPFTCFMLSGLKAAMTFESEDILKYVKTGFAGISSAEASVLENYVYVWSINGRKWLDDWNMDAKGFNPKQELQDIRKTDQINELRKRVVKPLQRLKSGLVGNAESMCRALFGLVTESTVQALKSYAYQLEQDGRLQESELQEAGYDAFIKVLDKCVAAFGSEDITPNGLLQTLQAVLKFETVGEIPQRADEVVFGTADRIRTYNPKTVFVIGANQDVFPAQINDSGLITKTEREILISNNINISDRSVKDCVDEKYLFYYAATLALDKVYISYSKASISGVGLEPCFEVSSLLEAFGKKIEVVKFPKDLCSDYFETAGSAFKKTAGSFKQNGSCINTLKYYFEHDPKFSNKMKALKDFSVDFERKITHESADKIYGNEIKFSSSKADDFANCKFMYFCKHGLNVRKLDKVTFNNLTRGNIVHACLEKFINRHMDDIKTVSLSRAEVEDEIKSYCGEFLLENGCDAKNLDEKFGYMMTVAVAVSTDLAMALNREFLKNSFKPVACELEVGDGNTVKAVKVTTDRGKTVSVSGYIDRVDTTNDGKIRVVDYKTGNKGKSFKVSELLYGQNMQMLLYLYALLQDSLRLFSADIAAGVMYFPAKKGSVDSESGLVRMNGIVLDDTETLVQMDPDLNGKLIPVKKKKDGTPGASDYTLSDDMFKLLFKYINLKLKEIGDLLESGDITPLPLKSGSDVYCKYCDYRSVCRISSDNGFYEKESCKNKVALERIAEEIKNKVQGGIAAESEEV